MESTTPQHDDRSAPEQESPARGGPSVDDLAPPAWSDPHEIELARVAQTRPDTPEGRAALGELLSNHERLVFSVCYRMCRNPEEARDVAQTAMLKAIKAFGRYDGRSKLSTWLYRIAMNTAISHHRSERLRRHASLDAESDESSGSRSSIGYRTEQTREPDVEAGVEQDERVARVRSALRQLDPETRAILILRDAQGLDYATIAEVLEVAVGTVKSRLFRARTKLREAVELQMNRPGGADQQSGHSEP